MRSKQKSVAYFVPAIGLGLILLLLGWWQWRAPVSNGANVERTGPAGQGIGLSAGDEPVVQSTAPADLGRNITAYQDIQIVWSKPMNQEATAQAVVIQPAVPYEIRWQEQGRSMIIHPRSPGFQPAPGGALYGITLTTKAMSEDGFHMTEDYSFHFFTPSCNG